LTSRAKLGSVFFEWDPEKAAANAAKHDVTFIEAASVFLDPLAITFADPDHSADEQREITIGHTMNQRLVFVSHCERKSRMRIISARLATASERRQYHEESIEDL
jgi:uncharacterized protein